MFREGDEKLKIISQGRAGKNGADSHGNSREQEFPSLSALEEGSQLISDPYKNFPELQVLKLFANEMLLKGQSELGLSFAFILWLVSYMYICECIFFDIILCMFIYLCTCM